MSFLTFPSCRLLSPPPTTVVPPLADAVALAHKALSASKQAALLLAEDSEPPPTRFFYFLNLIIPNHVKTRHIKCFLDIFFFCFVSSSVSSLPEEGTIVRSKKLLERRARNRRAPKPNGLDNESSYLPQKSNPKKKMRQGFDNEDALQLFLWGPETKQLLTAKEEAELIAHIQVCVCVC